MAAMGYSRDQILDKIVAERGGDAVAIPRDPRMKALSWMLPVGVLGGGLTVAVIFLSSRRRRNNDDKAGNSTPDVHAPMGPDEDAYFAQLDRELQEQKG